MSKAWFYHEARPGVIARAAALLGVLLFWLALWRAAHAFPSEYDWRYMTLSTLEYADQNPFGYPWARLGVMACGLGGALWNLMAALAPRERWAHRLLGLGFTSLACSALPIVQWTHIERSHEFLSLTAAFAISFGFTRLTYATVHAGHARTGLDARALAAAAPALLPVVLAALAQLYVVTARPDLPWVGLIWRSYGVPIYLSFAFWEWCTSLLQSSYLVALVLLTAAARRRSLPSPS